MKLPRGPTVALWVLVALSFVLVAYGVGVLHGIAAAIGPLPDAADEPDEPQT